MSFKKHQNYQVFLSSLQKLRVSLARDEVGFGCIYGSSEVLIEAAIKEVKQSFSDLGFQTTSIEASQWVQSQDLLSQVSLFDPLNLYIVIRCETIRSWPQWFKKNLPDDKSRQQKTVPSVEISKSNKVLFVFTSDRLLEGVQKELTALEAPLIPCFDPWPNDFPTLIRDLASKLQVQLTSDAIEALIEANGYDLIKLRNELSKLSLIFSNSTSPLTRSMIATHLGMLRSEDSFKMDRLLAERSWASAQSLILSLLDDGEKPLAILGIISYHCRNTLLVESARQSGLNPTQIQKMTGLTPMAIKTYLGASTRPKVSHYTLALKKCREADFAMKSSNLQGDLLLTQIIETLQTVQLTH